MFKNKPKKKKFSQRLANILCAPDQPAKARFNEKGITVEEGVAYDDAFKTVPLDYGLKGKGVREE